MSFLVCAAHCWGVNQSPRFAQMNIQPDSGQLCTITTTDLPVCLSVSGWYSDRVKLTHFTTPKSITERGLNRLHTIICATADRALQILGDIWRPHTPRCSATVTANKRTKANGFDGRAIVSRKIYHQQQNNNLFAFLHRFAQKRGSAKPDRFVAS